MNRTARLPPRGATLRAVLLTVIAVAAAALTWRLRPTAPIASGSADAAIVTGCAWLAWALAGYLATAVAAASLAHLVAGRAVAANALGRIAPARLRQLVDATVTLSVAATIVGMPAPAGAAAPCHVAIAAKSGSSLGGSALDWPGLATTSGAVVRPPRRPTPTAEPKPPHLARRTHHPHPRPASGANAQPSSTPVVVRPGDTLWAIAAHQLGPGASDSDITVAWHAWWAANHAVIGPNPGLIRPGQRLVPPANRPAPTH